jgi:hypothetical protein
MDMEQEKVNKTQRGLCLNYKKDIIWLAYLAIYFQIVPSSVIGSYEKHTVSCGMPFRFFKELISYDSVGAWNGKWNVLPHYFLLNIIVLFAVGWLIRSIVAVVFKGKFKDNYINPTFALTAIFVSSFFLVRSWYLLALSQLSTSSQLVDVIGRGDDFFFLMPIPSSSDSSGQMILFFNFCILILSASLAGVANAKMTKGLEESDGVIP